MKKIKLSLQKNINAFENDNLIKHHYSGAFIDQPLAIVLIFSLLPLFLTNIIVALATHKQIFIFQHKTDALSREFDLRLFNCGLWVKTAVLFDIALGKIGFCGIPFTHRTSPELQLNILNQINSKTGIFSLYDLHLKTGLAVTNKEQLLEEQLNGSLTNYLTLIIKSILCSLLYGQSENKLKRSRILSLFGLKVKNTSMDEAVNWITNTRSVRNQTKIGFFVNVHSINLAISEPTFFDELSKANALFADGSGMRLAATKAGFLLKGNNNGTDMLPHLCKRCIKNNQSLYFLGAQPGVAEKAAKKLTLKYPGLNIAGTEHGYTGVDNTEQLIAAINESGCDVLLVAMGSPVQEQWLLEHQDKLTCKTALAVGGLFDFYSGNISRSPMWLREIGMEWVWRLIQEPRSKFNRYVIGTPLFLYRTFYLGLANTGVK